MYHTQIQKKTRFQPPHQQPPNPITQETKFVVCINNKYQTTNKKTLSTLTPPLGKGGWEVLSQQLGEELEETLTPP